MGWQMKFNHLIIGSLILTFGISLFIRVYKLGESPRSVNWDEAAIGYNAFALYKTGHDEFGKYFPLSLQSFDDYKPALYTYFSVLPIALFGLNDVSVRLPSAVFGSILPIILIILISKITKDWRVGILSGLLLAFEPWALHFSRIAFEANIAMVLLYIGIAAILVFEKPYWGIVFGVLSMYGYHAQRVIALPIIFILIYFKNKMRPKVFLLTGFLLIPLAMNFTKQPITARFAATSIFKLAPYVPEKYQDNYSQTTAFGNQVIGRYLAYYSPANLFVRGSNEPVLRTPGNGMLTSFGFGFWLIGFGYLIKNVKKYKYLLPIFLLAPLPGVITWNWFSAVRTLTLYPLFSFVTAIGLYQIYNLLKYKVLKILLFLMFIPFWVYTINSEIAFAPVENYGEFQPGFEESVPYVLEKGKAFEKIIVNSPQAAPYIFYNFYSQLDPSIYITKKTERGSNAGTEQDYQIGKFEFRKILFEEEKDKNILIAGTAVSIKDGTPNTKDFYDPKGYVSVRVYAPSKE